jgi:hypothetical protein
MEPHVASGYHNVVLKREYQPECCCSSVLGKVDIRRTEPGARRALSESILFGHADLTCRNGHKRVCERPKSRQVLGRSRKPVNVPSRPVCPAFHTGQQTIPLQIRTMREYAATRDWTIVLQVKEAKTRAAS